MKKITMVYVAFLLVFNVLAQAPNFEWARGMGGVGDDRANSVAVDALGNVYTVGFFEGTADFDPGAGVYNLTSNGDRDIFIQKLNANGNFVWAKQIGGTGVDEGVSVSVDVFGNVLTTGTYEGTVDFDPGLGTHFLTNLSINGEPNVFIQKLDANGDFVWAKHFEARGWSFVYSITTDAQGNVYTSGWFEGLTDFDPSSNVYTLFGETNLFISKLDQNGNFVWAKQAKRDPASTTNNSDWEEGFSIAVDNFGNVYVTGCFGQIVDFDPGVGVHNLTSNGRLDVFLLKLDQNGDFLWVKQVGGTSLDYSFSVTTDALGNVYIGGSFMGTVDFDPGVGVHNLTANGSGDAFVLKLDQNGDFEWTKQIGGAGSLERVFSIAVDQLGNSYITGQFYGLVTFGTDTHTVSSVNVNEYDVLIAKFDPNGNTVWAQSVGGPDLDIGYSIKVGFNNEIYVGGWFNQISDFDPGAGVSNLTSFGNNDAFVLKLKEGGCTPATKTISESACGAYTWINGDGQIYTSSATATHTIPNGAASGCDSIVILNLTIYQPATKTISESACGAYTWINGDGQTYMSSATATHTIPNGAANGCDSIVILNLIVHQPATKTISESACGTYTWTNGDGQTYTSSTTATHTIPNGATNGCDSVVTLNLTIHQPATKTINASACGTYTWTNGDGQTYTSSTTATHTIVNGAANGCDSIVTLNLTINQPATHTVNQSACGSFTWTNGNGQTYTSSTTATHTIPNGAASGCDSVVTLNLTINNQVNNSITQIGNNLTANQEGGTYQWVNCENGNAPILNATGRTFVPTQNGKYAVIISMQDCIDTSACVLIQNISVGHLSESANISVFPNPTDGKIYVQTNLEIQTIYLFDIHGKKLQMTSATELDLSLMPSGVYFIKVELENNKIWINKIIKN